jgi:hypothetical protein
MIKKHLPMKLITTTVLIFSITLLKAQTNVATPNANFEHWTHVSADGGYDTAASWNSLNSFTAGPPIGIVTCYKDSTTVRSGKYSVLLVTQYFTLASELIPGTITTGTINPLAETISGGIPYTFRPDSIIGWYQYTPQSGDNGDIEFYLFGATHLDTIGQAFFKTPTTTVSTWTRFSLAVTYSSTATPDTALWIITSSDNQTTGHEGSQFIVDSLGLVFDTLSGINNIINPEYIKVGPNPTTGLVSINNSSNSQSLVFCLVDVTGRNIEQEKMATGTNYLELTGISEGVYIYYVKDEQNTIVKTGKIVVQR